MATYYDVPMPAVPGAGPGQLCYPPVQHVYWPPTSPTPLRFQIPYDTYGYGQMQILPMPPPIYYFPPLIWPLQSSSPPSPAFLPQVVQPQQFSPPSPAFLPQVVQPQQFSPPSPAYSPEGGQPQEFSTPSPAYSPSPQGSQRQDFTSPPPASVPQVVQPQEFQSLPPPIYFRQSPVQPQEVQSPLFPVYFHPTAQQPELQSQPFPVYYPPVVQPQEFQPMPPPVYDLPIDQPQTFSPNENCNQLDISRMPNETQPLENTPPPRHPRRIGCGFCHSNGECQKFWRSHLLRVKGKVTCPVLMKYVCPICNVQGLHTINYCPKNKDASHSGDFLKGRNAAGKPLKKYESRQTRRERPQRQP